MDNLKVAQNIACYTLKNIDRVCRKNNIEYFICAGTLLGAYRHGGFIPWDDDIDIAMTRENYNKFLKIAQKELGDEFFVQTKETDPGYDIFHVELKVRHNNSRVNDGKEHNYHQGVFVDIFAMDYVPNNKLVRNLQRNLSLIIAGADAAVNANFKNISFKNKVLYPILWFFSKKVSFEKRRKLISKLRSLTGNNRDLISYGLDSIWKTTFKYTDIYPIGEIEFDNIKVKAPNNVHNVLVAEYGENYMELPKEEDRIPSHFIGVELLDKRKVI
ncbi:phosphorylcholine transferase LicD [uncultured Clostridium sp.]|uniref:LicD family protein n=1 Tax=uncultured Clostridium sp. TaxID=59620 RepID=UPI002594EF43|nr:LicD family protein [uncultured Clostridium sp.]